MHVRDKRRPKKGGEMKPGIIWDLDGVIVDSARFILKPGGGFTAAKGKAFTQEHSN